MCDKLRLTGGPLLCTVKMTMNSKEGDWRDTVLDVLCCTWQCTSPVYPIVGSDIVECCTKKGTCDTRVTSYCVHVRKRTNTPGSVRSSRHVWQSWVVWGTSLEYSHTDDTLEGGWLTWHCPCCPTLYVTVYGVRLPHRWEWHCWSLCKKGDIRHTNHSI